MHGPGDIADNLRHSLTHISSRVEDQLHKGGALNVLALDVLDAVM